MSVIIAAHNAGRFIEAAVGSILEQSWTDLELIVVDDGSTDDTAERVQSFADGRIRLIRLDQNQGVSRARNAAIRAARAPLVAFLDADDVAERERIGAQVAFLAERDEVQVLGSAIRCIGESGEPLGGRVYPQAHSTILRTMPMSNPVALPAVMARKDVIVAEGGFDPDCFFVEDYDLWSRLALSGVQFANLPEALTLYRLHPNASKAASLKVQLRATIGVKMRYWRPFMGPAARARLAVERVLLHVPSAIVMWAFTTLTYRQSPVRRRQSLRTSSSQVE